MKYVLDTNALSALMKGDVKATGRLVSEARSDVLLPEPVVAEIAFGLKRLPESAKRRQLDQRFSLFCEELNVVAWSREVSLSFGEIKATLERRGTPLEDFDIAIAAHALANDAVLVTANPKHMKRIRGLTLQDWCK
jgi:tRNA(fMet)-specific endonuclease VapC